MSQDDRPLATIWAASVYLPAFERDELRRALALLTVRLMDAELRVRELEKELAGERPQP